MFDSVPALVLGIIDFLLAIALLIWCCGKYLVFDFDCCYSSCHTVCCNDNCGKILEQAINMKILGEIYGFIAKKSG